MVNLRNRLDNVIKQGIGLSLSWKETKELIALQAENKRLRDALDTAETDIMMICPGLNRNNALGHIKQAIEEAKLNK